MTYVELERIMLSEAHHKPRATHDMISPIWNAQNRQISTERERINLSKPGRKAMGEGKWESAG